MRSGGARTIGLFLVLNFCGAASAMDLTRAAVVYPAKFAGPEKKAIDVLVEEVAKRTQVRWAAGSARPGPQSPFISVDRSSGAPEGYSIRVRNGGVEVTGNDARGVLFGVGRLLRTLRMSRGSIVIPDGFQITTAPKYSLRGHQLGYRPKPNSYDGWTVEVWDQYIRDLAVFGANAIELIPPRSDDASDSPHFPLPQMEMMTRMSGIVNDYGLDVWIWYPAMDPDYANPKTVESALTEWGDVFRKLPRVDAVFVPGGDPGHTQPKYLMALLEKQTKVLRRYHPKAQIWVSRKALRRRGPMNSLRFSRLSSRPG
ncbi:MAG: glycoside hydrolase family 20 zincin-like fold domain-containing protein [Bryobacteraceae bacterium]